MGNPQGVHYDDNYSWMVVILLGVALMVTTPKKTKIVKSDKKMV